MKMYRSFTIGGALLLGFLIFNFTEAAAFGQGTAFTYQGRLMDGSGGANGIYDLRFMIYDSTNLPGVVVAGPVTNATTAVSNGLFTVSLDFGAGVFTGPDRWLEIAVRTNGVVAFTTIAPRQKLTPTPYAMSAGNLASVVANNTVNAAASSTVGGGTGNISTALFSTVGGGAGNSALGLAATVAGGGNNSSSVANTTIGGGVNNRADKNSATIAGGSENHASGDHSAIGGGQSNAASGDFTAIGGGVENNIQTNVVNSVIAGGINNLVQSNATTCFIGGGSNNTIQANALFATIGAGTQNTVVSNTGFGTITGGRNNKVSNFGFVGGGGVNFSLGDFSVVAGGQLNTNGGNSAFIGGGRANTNNGSFSAVGGGEGNLISVAGPFAAIAGGLNNVATNEGVTIGGGEVNRGSGLYAAIGGGANNTAEAQGSFIGGGEVNRSSGFDSVIGGGNSNTNSGNFSAIGGGYLNVASGDYSVVGGGVANIASGEGSTIAGGFSANLASGSDSSIGGGGGNNASGYGSTISGGVENQASGLNGTVPGGVNNVAQGAYSFAAGQQAEALHTGAFVWADSQDDVFFSTAQDQFDIRAQGGVGINKNNPASTLDVNGTERVQGANNWDVTGSEGDFRVGNDTYRFKIGVANAGSGSGDVWMRAQGGTGRVFLKTPGGTIIYSNEGQTSGVSLAAGGGGWSNLSDRNAKENFASVNAQEILQRVTALPLTSWNYKSQEKSIRHIGPMAQDFAAAFQVGEDERHITTIDADGVALAAIQGLNQKMEAENASLRDENNELKKRLERLEQLIISK